MYCIGANRCNPIQSNCEMKCSGYPHILLASRKQYSIALICFILCSHSTIDHPCTTGPPKTSMSIINATIELSSPQTTTGCCPDLFQQMKTILHGPISSIVPTESHFILLQNNKPSYYTLDFVAQKWTNCSSIALDCSSITSRIGFRAVQHLKALPINAKPFVAILQNIDAPPNTKKQIMTLNRLITLLITQTSPPILYCT